VGHTTSPANWAASPPAMGWAQPAEGVGTSHVGRGELPDLAHTFELADVEGVEPRPTPRGDRLPAAVAGRRAVSSCRVSVVSRPVARAGSSWNRRFRAARLCRPRRRSVL
jgi:hypothetical protein